MWTIIISLILVSYLENIPYQKHWRIEGGGGQEDLAPLPPPKIG